MVNSKQKGSAFERKICVELSLWVTQGKQRDCFWRSAMSGGRATVQKRAGRSIRQSGDITAVAPEGHVLTNQFCIECKHVKKLDIASFILNNRGALAKFWKQACKQARDHLRQPLLIAKENGRDALVICRPHGLRMYCVSEAKTISPEIRFLSELLNMKFPNIYPVRRGIVQSLDAP
jgi:hypothetical protein